MLRLARPLRSLALRLRGTASPARFLPGAMSRYRDSWRSADVARQMLALTEQQLRAPEEVAPYRAFRALLDALLAEEALPRPARFLDIGCGVGAYGDLLERWAPGRFEYVGADYSQEIVEAARSRAPGRTFGVRDLFEPGALDGFDVVFASALVDVLADFHEAFDLLLAADAGWVILHRQRVGAGRSHVAVSPGYRGQRTYRSYLTARELEEAAGRHGRRIEASVDVEGDVRSFLLGREPA